VAQQPKDRAALYREKAEEARTMADGMTDTCARATVLEVVASWERLARAEDARKKPSQN